VITDKLFLRSVNEAQVMKDQSPGFLQGSNVILNIVKRWARANLSREYPKAK
jgi:hypothetical protein